MFQTRLLCCFGAALFLLAPSLHAGSPLEAPACPSCCEILAEAGGPIADLKAIQEPEPAQDPVQQGLGQTRRRGEKPPVLTRNPVVKSGKDSGKESSQKPATSTQRQPQQQPGGPANPRTRQLNLSGAQGAPPASDPKAPRPQRPGAPVPFLEDRPILEVDGVAISTSELNELVAYYHSFRPGSVDLLLRDAVEALIPTAVMKARFAEALPAMKAKAEQAAAKLKAGEDFSEVVREYSDDSEGPEDGRYRFGREIAVQPFDRLSHTSKIGEVQGPFLTRYGYHLMAVVSYEQGAEPKLDQTEVQHVLIMYPFQSEKVRAEIREAVKKCKIKVLEAGLQNIVPPEMQAQVEKGS